MYAPEMTYIGIDPSLFHDPFTDFAAVPDYINDRLAQFQNGSERIFKNLTQTELDVKLIKNPPVRDIVNGKVDIMADVFAERFSVWKRAMPGGGGILLSRKRLYLRDEKRTGYQKATGKLYCQQEKRDHCGIHGSSILSEYHRVKTDSDTRWENEYKENLFTKSVHKSKFRAAAPSG